MILRQLARAVLVACLAPVVAADAQKTASAGDGVIYIGTYANKIYEVSESTMRIIDSIPSSIGIPTGLLLSANHKHLYVTEPRNEKFEVIDLATKKSLDTYTLSNEDRRVMIWGAQVDPKERFAVFLIKTYQKKNDRWEIGKPTMVKYDFARKVVTDTIPWPKGEEREFAQILFSPSGDLMYFFGSDVLIYDSQTLKQVDRWELGRSLDEGMGRFNFGFPEDVFEEPGFYTGLFQVSDPVQHRSLMGVARVDLVKRQVDVFTLGPSEPLRFALAPGKKRAYGLRGGVGNYEFWSFDLESRRVIGRTPFKGRPRMGLGVSSNGKYIYIHTAGPTIDLYDTETFKLVRTVDLGADMTDFLLLPRETAAPAR
jgi:DNA-binding beta-propeller fold protein YncE